jgi:acyl dehydratase
LFHGVSIDVVVGWRRHAELLKSDANTAGICLDNLFGQIYCPLTRALEQGLRGGNACMYGMKEVGPNRYREVLGRYFEDFEIGHIYEHRPGRTITEADNIWFTLLTMNTHPLHFDNEYAKHSEFGKPLVNSAFTLAVVTGMSVSDTSQKAIANLGWSDIKLTAPVFVGDTIYAESEVLEKRQSQSRPTQGIVTMKTSGLKQDGTVFMAFSRAMLMPKRGHATEDMTTTY